MPEISIRDHIGKWVMHAPTRVVGKVAKYFEPGEYTCAGGERPVSCGVVQLEDGNSFCDNEDNPFVLLDPGETVFIGAFSTAVGYALTEGVKLAVSLGVGSEKGVLLMRSMLQRQVDALGAKLEATAPSPG